MQKRAVFNYLAPRFKGNDDINLSFTALYDESHDVRTFDAVSGQVTDATISPDGRHVALRTYASILVFDVPEKAEIDSIWAQQPRVYRLADGSYLGHFPDLGGTCTGTSLFTQVERWMLSCPLCQFELRL